MLYETLARIYNKRMLIAQDCANFAGAGRGHIARQRFLVNFADFPDIVRVKKSRFRSVDGDIWN